MEAIVAVYADWGIGAKGTQPIKLRADRSHFREKTMDAAVSVGRKTMEDFPGGKPLQGRRNIVVTSRPIEIKGAVVVHTLGEGLAEAEKSGRTIVIGGASIYRQYFPYIDRVFVTMLKVTPQSDVFFPNLDRLPEWKQEEAGPWEEENGILYQYRTYIRQKEDTLRKEMNGDV